MKNLRMWFKSVCMRREVRAWLKANNPEAIAAQCMFHLNRHARASLSHRGIIYDLKNLLIYHLDKSGYTKSISRCEQIRDCWSCHGTGYHHDGADCWKCGGSGIYASHILYLFRFSVGSRSYSWHQPADMVDWSINPQAFGEALPEYQGAKNGVPLTADQINLYGLAVQEYLKLQGYAEVSPLPTFKMALRRDLKWLRKDIERWWWHRRHPEEIPF